VTHSHGDGGAHSHTGTASYLWLDFAQAAQQAAAISAAIIRRAPGNEDAVAANLEALVNDLFVLDAQAREIGAASAGATVIASHPRYLWDRHPRLGMGPERRPDRGAMARA
jgi:zinc transport system substrate-binding protein